LPANPTFDLRIASDAWTNIDGDLLLEQLRGHVVWPEFSFIACVGCRMMKPILYGLQHEFGARGLVVLEIDNGGIDTRDALAAEVRRRQPNYPVLWDVNGATCDSYGIEKYGAAYLIGTDGKVLWGGTPTELKVNELWPKVAGALRDVDSDWLAQCGAPFHLTARTATDALPPPQESNGPTISATDSSSAPATTPWSSTESGPGAQPTARPEEGDIVLSIADIVPSKVPFEVLNAKLHELEEGPRTVELRVERGGDIVDLVVEPPDGACD
jgi:hypothetical protein